MVNMPSVLYSGVTELMGMMVSYMLHVSQSCYNRIPNTAQC